MIMPQERWLMHEHADGFTIARAYSDALDGGRIEEVPPDEVRCDKQVLGLDAIMLAEATILVVDSHVEVGGKRWVTARNGHKVRCRRVFEQLLRHWVIYADPMAAAARWLKIGGRLPYMVELCGTRMTCGGPWPPRLVHETEIQVARFKFTSAAWGKGWRAIEKIHRAGGVTSEVSIDDIAYLFPSFEVVSLLCEKLGISHACSD